MRSQTQKDALQDSVVELKEEVRVLRDALDELREELTYALRNGRLCLSFERFGESHAPAQQVAKSSSEETTSTDQQRQPSSGFLFETK